MIHDLDNVDEPRSAESAEGPERLVSRRRLLEGFGALAVSSASLGTALDALVATGRASAATGALERRGGVLRVGLSGEPDLLDPAKSALAVSQEVWHHVFSRLVRLNPDSSIAPDVARSWRLQGDRTWIFDLVPGIRFHNGDALTAKDVKYSFTRLLAKKTASPWREKFPDVERIEVISPTRIAFHLKQPFAPFLVSLALNGQVVNRRSIESGTAPNRPIGSGPFRLTEWVKNDHLTLVRNPRYFQRDVPKLDGARLRFVEVSPSQVQSLKSNELDYLDGVPSHLVAQLAKDSSLTLVRSRTAGKPQLFAFNVTKPPFDNKFLRQAIAWGVNRNVIRDVALFGNGEVGSQEVPQGSRWFDGAADPYRRGPDLNRARQLVEQSGLPTPITVEYLAWTTAPYPARIGEIIRDQLRPIGINVEVQQIEISQWLNRLFAKNYQMTLVFNEGTVDPDNIYSLFFKSDSGLNFVGYKSPAFDTLVERARSEHDFARRKSLYRQVRAKLFDDVPAFFIHYDTPNYLMRKSVVGATTRPSLELGLEFVELRR